MTMLQLLRPALLFGYVIVASKAANLVTAFSVPPKIGFSKPFRSRSSCHLSNGFTRKISSMERPFIGIPTNCWAQKTSNMPLESSEPISTWVKKERHIVAAGVFLVVATFCNPAVSSAAQDLLDIGLSSSGGAAAVTSTIAAYIDKISKTGFWEAFSLIFVSEIGDKTFFIAGLLAMKTSRFVSFIGSIGALAAMTVISVVIGQIFHAVPVEIGQGLPLDDIAAVAAFTFFGFKTLKEAYDMDSSEGNIGMDEEIAEAKETVEASNTIRRATAWGQIVSTFALVFAAEFGDRSFLSTIALSAAQNPFSVGIGAILAHGLATGIAVAGGAYVAKYISEKVIGYIGGSLFLIFAATTAFEIF